MRAERVAPPMRRSLDPSQFSLRTPHHCSSRRRPVQVDADIAMPSGEPLPGLARRGRRAPGSLAHQRRPAAANDGGGVVLVIVDGLGEVCGARADTPALDALVRAGQSGLMDPVAPGLACGSDTAHLALFGVEPRGCYRGRGAFEAAGDGMEIRPGDVAFKCNFARVEGGVVVARCAGKGETFASLCREWCERELDGVQLQEFPNVEVSVKWAMKHRCAVRIRAPVGVLTDKVTGTDPLVDGQALRECKVDGGDDDVSSADAYTAAVVNGLHSALAQKLAGFWSAYEDRLGGDMTGEAARNVAPNVILLRGASEGVHLETRFPEKHGLSSFLIAPTKIIAGVGRTVGLPVHVVPGATGDYRTDYGAKASAVVERMTMRASDACDDWLYDLGVLHIKAVDDAGHDGLLGEKLKHMKHVDALVQRIAEGLVARGRGRVRLAVTGDHTTAVSFRDHTCEPVLCLVAPAASLVDIRLVDSAWFSDNATVFEETDVGMHGCLGRFSGLQLIPLLSHHIQCSS